VIGADWSIKQKIYVIFPFLQLFMMAPL